MMETNKWQKAYDNPNNDQEVIRLSKAVDALALLPAEDWNPATCAGAQALLIELRDEYLAALASESYWDHRSAEEVEEQRLKAEIWREEHKEEIAAQQKKFEAEMERSRQEWATWTQAFFTNLREAKESFERDPASAISCSTCCSNVGNYTIHVHDTGLVPSESEKKTLKSRFLGLFDRR